MVEPGKLARQETITDSLESLQEAVGGLIETVYPFDDNVCLVCNDEGKILGMEPNRALREPETNAVTDVICGSFFICGIDGDSFASLTPEQAEKYRKQYYLPEEIFSIGGRISALPYVPNDLGRGLACEFYDHER